MENLRHNAPILCVKQLAVTYPNDIANNLLCIINDILVYIEPVTVSTNHICHIIFQLSHRRIIFIALYVSSAANHMEEYKMRA